MQGQAAEAFCSCEEVLTETKFPFVKQRNHRRTARKHHQINLKLKVSQSSALPRNGGK